MKNVLEYLELTATKFKDKVAVEDKNKSSTYFELLNVAQRTGSYLSKSITPGSPVPVFMEKGVDTLGAFFGIVYAGGFYVLINPELPQSRIEQILSVLEKDFVLTTHEYDDKINDLAAIKKALYLEDRVNTPILEDSLQAIRGNSLDIDPLYANFTSGSTGTPKGVVVSHRSVIDFIDVFTELFNISDKDVIGNQAPFDFDVSVKDIYSAIKTGAKLEIVPRELFSAPMKLADFLCEREITTMIWAVSALCLMTTFHVLDYKVPITVNKVLFSGETMPMKHLKQWMMHLPEADFVNLYGPTEITCNCTYYRVKELTEETKALPIGEAFPNEKVFLLNEENESITGFNKNGEICVSGSALSLGYYNNQAETEKRFVQNPLNSKYREVIYRTGDLGYYNESGELCFAGRKDFQIKYMGHRIELEEIEAALVKIEGVDRACCIFREEKNKLSAFFVGTIDAKMIRQKLAETLPNYMLPSKYFSLDSIPLTANGKMDRKKLKIMLGDEYR
ncbi:MAG: amino acid adenylation domain-containing protein [Oscillospiraceae bacterium]